MLKASRRIRNYIKYDLKEIIAPSPLPNPPGEKLEKFRLADLWRAVRLGTREYIDTWKKKAPAAGEEKGTPKEPPIIDELLGAAKGGATGLKPILQNLYRTRASAYQQAVRSFVEGYREGLAEPSRSMADWGTQSAGPQAGGPAQTSTGKAEAGKREEGRLAQQPQQPPVSKGDPSSREGSDPADSSVSSKSKTAA